MSNHTSPFAALTGAEKQIRWLEYQSIRLPYVHGSMDKAQQTNVPSKEPDKKEPTETLQQAATASIPQPPPEVPRTMPDMRSRHSQYDAVIARLKQAELQSRRLQTSEQR